MSLQLDNQTLKVSGVLSLKTIRKAYLSGCKIIREKGVSQVDFSDAKIVDSSALALLTSWLRIAKSVNKTIVYKNLPLHLVEVAKLSNIDKIITTGNNNG